MTIDVMNLLGSAAAGIVAAVAVSLWGRNRAKIEPTAEKIGEWAEEKTGLHAPDWASSALKWMVRAAVQGLDSAFSSKEFWRFAYNKIRHEQGETIADEFQRRMELVDWSKALKDQCPAEYVDLYNQAREAAAQAHVEAQVAVEAAAAPDSAAVKKLQDAVSAGAVAPMVKACVVARKAEAVAGVPAVLGRPPEIQAEIERIRAGIQK